MGILDRITKAHEAGEEHLKCLLWGPNGTGKSTLCGTAPGPVLYCYTERQGLLSFKRMAPDEDALRIRGVQDMRDVLAMLKSGDHQYASICLDSFTEMQMLIIDEVAARKERDPNEPVKLSIEERLFIHDRSKAMVRAFRDLPMNVIVTCLSEQGVVGDGEDAKTVTKLMLSGQKLPAQLGAFFNLVGFTYKGATSDSHTAYRVLFEGRRDIDTKGMPGLRQREEPDIGYWYDRAIGNADARDEKATMILPVSRRWASAQSEDSNGGDEAK
jgi:hypothetical protein